MNRRTAASRLALTLLCLALAVGGWAVAGSTPARAAATVRIEQVDARQHPQVQLTIATPLTDAGGPIQVTLTENGVARPVTVTPAAAAQLRVVVLLDTSGSMVGEGISGARAAAHAFAERLPQDTSLALLSFADRPALAAGFDTPRTQFGDAVDRLSARGETALYDALNAALDLLAEHHGDERRVLVVLSDGGDTASHATLDQLTARLREAETQLVMVELATAETDHFALATLVDAAAGELKTAADPAALSSLYDGIARELSRRFHVTYESHAAGDAALLLRVTDASGTSAETTTSVALPAKAAAARPFGMIARPGPLSSRPAVIAAILAVGLALGIVGWSGPRPGRRRARAGIGAERNALSGVAIWATRTAEETLERHRWGGQLNRQLEDASIDLRPGEFTVLGASLALTGGVLGHLLVGLPGAVAGAALTVALIWVAVQHLVRRRRAQFAEQLGDTLQLLAGSLRAGHSLVQAIDAVAREADPPTSQEFRRLVVETRLGRPLSATVSALAKRMDSPDFSWVAEAIIIHREVGGDLSQILDRAAATIRERNQIRRQAKALSAEGRLSAIILVALPVFVSLFVSVANPGYLAELTTTPVGLTLLGVGLVLLTVGGVWLKRIVKVVF